MTEISKKELNKYLSDLNAYLKEWYIPEPVELCEGDGHFPYVMKEFSPGACFGVLPDDDYPGLDEYIQDLDDSFGDKVKKLSSEKKVSAASS